MEMLSLIISIISIIVSAIITGIPFYHKHWQKKTEIALIACDGIVRNDVIRIVAAYVNRNWLNATITNSHIGLTLFNSPSKLTKVNHEHCCNSFSPIGLTEKMQASIELTYSLSELKEVDLENAEIYVYTEYIDSKGRKLSDSHKIGTLHISGINTKMVLVESQVYELQGRNFVMSMKL